MDRPEASANPASSRKSPREPGQVLACGWCGGPVIVQVRGRMPKWCSPTCRTRASERRRAAAEGLAAVKVVDRDVERVRTVKVVQHHTHQVEVEVVRWPSATTDWVTALRDLTRRVESGRVYDRDLEGLAEAVNELVGALVRRGRRG
ncbi:MAG: hypothetical protein LCH77_13880 [Actinobacteria bacterium]|uniref:hypothetical protein n=1 Tax=Nostocoides veronense TaxID=330836 RepID=UPI0031CE2D07|nr:hypothetical protein [Actinomycetota bacterium]